MWGRAAQTVLTVIALVLVHPAAPSFPTTELAPFVVSGRAFPTLQLRAPLRDTHHQIERRTPHAYARLASIRYVAPANRTAVIVGINNAKGTPSLPGSIRDAKNLYSALLRYGFPAENITLLLEGEATRPAILGALDSMAARASPTGISVFAAATHTRRSRGTNSLATAEGGRISASELASHLRAVRSRMWIALPTCYAAGYALPGIVGQNRIATFASSGDRQAYQAGDAGSFLFIHMVRRAMLEGRAPYSVESAFAFAHAELSRDYPEHLPSMSDGIPEDLVLGPIQVITARWTPEDREDPYRGRLEYTTYEAADENSEAPSPTPRPRRRAPGSVCGSVRFNCAP